MGRRVRAAAQRRAPDPYYGNLNHTVHNQARARRGPLASGSWISWPGQAACRLPSSQSRPPRVRDPSRFLHCPR